jgi:hypothetical protein
MMAANTIYVIILFTLQSRLKFIPFIVINLLFTRASYNAERKKVTSSGHMIINLNYTEICAAPLSASLPLFSLHQKTG